MQTKTTLNIVDGIRVVVPDSLDLITTYVLREQNDWFEDEIKFVRLLLGAGQKVIDIGANYGLFALSMASIVGPQGRVWAFEPASSTAAFLAESLVINGYTQVTLDQRALSEKAGTAQLSLNDQAELNELVRGGARAGAGAGAVETVQLTSLDDAMAQYDWDDIAFMKIDAEGEEAAIIRGGTRFWQTQSPLVQYEVKAGSSVHLELVEAFARLGYASYRLVPGLGALMPFDATAPIDGYLLNLFACKPDRAARLAADGRLVPSDDTDPGAAAELLQRHDAPANYGWQKTLATLPYGKKLKTAWLQTVRQGHSGHIEQALALHALAHAATVPLAQRLAALRASLAMFEAMCR